MKQIATIAIILLLSIGGWAQENKQADAVKALTDKVQQLDSANKALNQKLSERDKLYEQHLSQITDERSEFIDFVDKNVNFIKTIIATVGAIITVLLIFLGIKQGKSLKEYRAELKEKSESEIKKINDQMILEVSRLIQLNPVAIRTTIDERIKDAEIRKRTSICLIYTSEKDKNEIRLQLIDYGIQNITEKKITQNEELANFFKSRKGNDVLFLIDSSEIVEKGNHTTTQLSDYLNTNKAIIKGGLSYFYKGKGTFPSSDNYIANYAKTNATVYQNLMDLMRYLNFRQSL